MEGCIKTIVYAKYVHIDFKSKDMVLGGVFCVSVDTRKDMV